MEVALPDSAEVTKFLEKTAHMNVRDIETARDHWKNFTEAFTNILKKRNLKGIKDHIGLDANQLLQVDDKNAFGMDTEIDVKTQEGEQEISVSVRLGYDFETPKETDSRMECFDKNKPLMDTLVHGQDEVCGNKSTSYASVGASDVFQCNDDLAPSDHVVSASDIELRLDNRHKTKVHMCQSRKRGFCSFSKLARHKKSVHKEVKKFPCYLCEQVFQRQCLLDKHLRRTHHNLPSTKEPDVKCDQCGRLFTSNSNLKVHVRHCHDGKREFVCSECGKFFQTKSNLNRHVQSTHKGLRPWQCMTCTARFTEKKSLERHAAVHSGVKMYRCDQCGKFLATKWSLTQHQAQHSKIRPYLCDTCGQTFVTKSNLDGHKQIHLGIRTHPCTLCKRCFYSKGDLDRHMRSHTGVKPYSCQVCSKAFSRLEYLHEHLNAHAGVTPYICATCGKGFSDRSGFHKHSKRCALRTIITRQTSDKPVNEDESLTQIDVVESETIETSVILPEASTVLEEPDGQTVTYVDIDVKEQPVGFSEPLQLYYPSHEEASNMVTSHVIHVTSEDVGDGRMTGEQMLKQIQVTEESQSRTMDISEVQQDHSHAYCVLNDDKADFVIPTGALVSEETGLTSESELGASNIHWYVQEVVREDTWHDSDMA